MFDLLSRLPNPAPSPSAQMPLLARLIWLVLLFRYRTFDAVHQTALLARFAGRGRPGLARVSSWPAVGGAAREGA